MTQFVSTEITGSVGIVTIDRPDKLNALSTVVMNELREGFAELEPDSDLVLLRTTGDAFSAGADLTEIDGSDLGTFEAFQSNSVRTYRTIQSHPAPVIAVVDGVAYGGGFGLAISANLIVAEEKVEFALPEVQLGIVPAAGGIIKRLAANVGLNKATELLTTGEAMPASEAHRAGLVNRLAPRGGGLEAAHEFADEVTQNPGPAVQACAEIANRSFEISASALSRLEIDSSVRLYGNDETRNRIASFASKP